MLHLDVLGKAACGADGGQRHSYTDPEFSLDLIDCPACKSTLFFEAAERLVMSQPNEAVSLIDRLLQKSGHSRISGILGDPSVETEGMTRRERFKARSATMSAAESAEHLARINDMVRDTCPSCGGSIKHQEHSEDCLGPDPDDWHGKLTDEQVDAELRVQGIDPVASKAKFREHLDRLAQKALAKIEEVKAEGSEPEEEYDPSAPYEPMSDEYWGADDF